MTWKIIVAVLFLLPPLESAPITFRLMRSDLPGELASTAVTKIDLDAEAAKARADAEAAREKAALAGQTIQIRDPEIKPKARFERYSNYMRGILIDGKHPFHRSYKGSYLGRSDVITLELEDGEHFIDPGGHVFTVQEGKVSTNNPVLRADGATLDVTLVPVTVIAVDGSAVRSLPAEVRRLPVAPRIFWGDEMLLPKEKLLAEEATFERLTLYMMANEVGAGYRVMPGERQFHVTTKGLRIVDAEGRPANDPGVQIEGANTLVLPRYAVPVTVKGKGVQVTVAGSSGMLKLLSLKDDELVTKPFYAFSTASGSSINFGNRARNEEVTFYGDLGVYPRRSLLIDNSHPASGEPRLLSVSLPGFSVKAGGEFPVRVQFKDALDAQTLLPPQVKAFLWRQSVLADNGWLRELPATDAALSEWQSAPLSQTSDPEVFSVGVPQVPASVYVLRLVVGRRGECSPDSPLQADFILGVTGESGATLSVFTPVGRHGFFLGKDLPISVVLKTANPLSAAELFVTMKSGDRVYEIFRRPMPAGLPEGKHPFHLMLDGATTRALEDGDYTVEAAFGALRSNQWKVILREPQFENVFPHYDDGWAGYSNIDHGFTYYNVPKSIREANENLRMIQRSGEVHARQTNLNVSNWSGHTTLERYQGRDSSSEVAQVENILRSSLGLPAHEQFYYGNFLERAFDTLSSQGMGEYNTLYAPFSPRSLIHSTPKEVQSKMRQYQLTAQIARKFDNFLGMTLVKDDTVTTGDSEVGDSGRAVRMRIQMENFVKKHGFKPPSGTDAYQFLKEITQGRTTPELTEVARRWEAWAADENRIRGDYFKLARESVNPLFPGLRFGEQGPAWGATETGDYPMTALRNATTLLVQSGAGDYGMQLILHPLVRTRFFKMTGAECWGTLGFNGNHGFYQLKTHLAGYLAAGAKGFGYYSGMRKEAENPRAFMHTGYHEERRDIRDLLHTYGNLFRSFDPVADIGVFYSFRQSMYDYVGFDIVEECGNTKDGVFSAIAQLALLGHNSEVLTEEHIDAGDLARYKVVVVPAFNYALPAHVHALEAFAAKGGLLLVGSKSKLLPRGAFRIDDDFKEMHNVNDIWSFNAMCDIGTAYLFGEMKRKIPVLKAALEKTMRPFAQAETDRTFVQTSRAGDGRLTFVWAHLNPSFMGTTRVTSSATWSMHGGEANETVFLPLKEWVTFPKARTTYEIYTNRRITGVENGETIRTQVDLSHTPVRFFLSLPNAIAGLKIQATNKAATGDTLPIALAVVDEAGDAINAPIPLLVSLRDPQGRLFAERHPAAFLSTKLDLVIPFSGTAGTWKMVVRELASGLEFEHLIAVTDASAGKQAVVLTASEVPAVDVQRGELIRNFISDRKKDGAPVLILLSEEQEIERLGLARELKAALDKLGVKCEIRQENSEGVFSRAERVHLYQNWTELKPAQYIDHHVALLGGEGEFALLEELQESQLLLRPLSAHYPGPGRGILALVRSAFAFGRDALVIAGPDDKGIRAAIGTLADLPAVKTSTPARQAESGEAKILKGQSRSGSSFSRMDGDPVQVVSVSSDGAKIGIGTLGYARNVFVFNRQGEPLFEDKVGHVNTGGIQFVDGDELLIQSDGRMYRRGPDGKLHWQIRGRTAYDPRGRYVIHYGGRWIQVLSPSLEQLWRFDEWDQFHDADEILFGRKPELLGIIDNGDTILLRLKGKAPGITGDYGDYLLHYDALTGEQKKKINFDLAKCVEATGLTGDFSEELQFVRDGKFCILTIRTKSKVKTILLDSELQPIQVEQFEIPYYAGGLQTRVGDILLPDKRLAFTCGDSLHVSDGSWRTLSTLKTNNLILSLAHDEPRGRLAISNYSGLIQVVDTNLKPIWKVEADAAAQLAFLPDGSLVAGNLRGKVFFFTPEGEKKWEADVSRYEEPDWVEKRWLELEALPGLNSDSDSGETLFARIRRDVGLGEDAVGLAGEVSAGKSLVKEIEGTPFGIYAVEWENRRVAGDGGLSLKVIETEKLRGMETVQSVSRLTLNTQPGEKASMQEALLQLGGRTKSVRIEIAGSGNLRAATGVAVRPINFPSRNLLRVANLYDGQSTAGELSQMPVRLELFRSSALRAKIGAHITRWADPYKFINGRLFESEPALLDGKWFGDGNFFLNNYWMELPCFIDITLPQKEVLTHFAMAEDPSLPRLSAYSIEAYIESYDRRSDLSDLERRQLKRGFWKQLVKVRDNHEVYHFHKFDPPVFSKNLRIHLIEGHSSITEVELYGGMETIKKLRAAEKAGKEEVK
ncbi:MAG: hypothetical protein O3B01_20260 [Planctomycetota bacterium]|nr:hypothetical protein [Planctomycetota bacterium]